MNKYTALQEIKKRKVIAVLRSKNKTEALKTIDALVQGGITIIEVTTSTPGIIGVLEEANEKYGDDILIGAGTVLDSETARACILAGAKYIVSPSLFPDTIRLCNRYGIPVFPGINTVTEAVTALELGVDILKLFPASNLKPSTIKAIKAPIPNAEIIPTGGVGLNNIADWLANGAFAVGVGGSLLKKADLGDFDGVAEEAKKYVDLIASLEVK